MAGRWRPSGGRSASRPCSRAPSSCACGGSSTGCPTPTTRTRTRISSRKAIGLFGHGWNPHYYVNPPAYTYLLHVVFAVWFGGRDGVYEAYATDPTEVFVVARVTAAVRRHDRDLAAVSRRQRACSIAASGCSAAGLFAVSFLPVFYSHLALNDVPTLAPICLALWGAAGVLRFGRDRDYLIAGLGLGLAAATKYTGGIVLLPLLAAIAAQFLAPGGHLPARRGALIALGASVAGFLVANPYALLDFGVVPRRARPPDHRRRRCRWASSASPRTTAPSTTCGRSRWGLGLDPAARGDRRGGAPCGTTSGGSLDAGPGAAAVRPVHGLAGALLRPLAHAGLPGRLPAGRLRRSSSPTGPRAGPRPCARRSWRSPTVALCGQGLVYSLHNGLVLSRDDTRNLDAPVAGRARAGAHEDRRRAGGARRLGAGPRLALDRRPPTATGG